MTTNESGFTNEDPDQHLIRSAQSGQDRSRLLFRRANIPKAF